VSRQFDGILFDLDGVLVTGGSPLPGAVETLQTLLAAGVPFLILSNMTLWSRRMMLDRFRRYGLDLAIDRMLTPPAAATRWLERQGNPPVVAFVAEPTRIELTGLQLLPEGSEGGAAFVLVGDLGDGWTPQILNRALRLLLNGARFIALGMGRYWMAPDGVRLDVGAFATALAYASGQTPIVIGKPSADYFQMALDALGVPADRVVMVGDDILNDIEAAQQVGLKGVLVQTGKFRPDDLRRGVTPEWTVPDVTHVLSLLGLAPTQAI
jgi:phospholysine phosphohistidine inorganic pyrophosphate phosphatase